MVLEKPRRNKSPLQHSKERQNSNSRDSGCRDAGQFAVYVLVSIRKRAICCNRNNTITTVIRSSCFDTVLRTFSAQGAGTPGRVTFERKARWRRKSGACTPYVTIWLACCQRLSLGRTPAPGKGPAPFRSFCQAFFVAATEEHSNRAKGSFPDGHVLTTCKRYAMPRQLQILPASLLRCPRRKVKTENKAAFRRQNAEKEEKSSTFEVIASIFHKNPIHWCPSGNMQ